MMKYYKVIYPSKFGNQIEIKNSHQIIEEYWEYWQSKAKRCNANESDITYERCIDDYIVVNWAVQCDKEGNPLK